MGTTIHVSEVKRILDRAEKSKAPDDYQMDVATLSSASVIRYRGSIVGCHTRSQRYRVKVHGSGLVRTVPLCLIMNFEGKEVIW